MSLQHVHCTTNSHIYFTDVTIYYVSGTTAHYFNIVHKQFKSVGMENGKWWKQQTNKKKTVQECNIDPSIYHITDTRWAFT